MNKLAFETVNKIANIVDYHLQVEQCMYLHSRNKTIVSISNEPRFFCNSHHKSRAVMLHEVNYLLNITKIDGISVIIF